MQQDPYKHAIDDLAWRYQEADEAIGVRGQSLSGSGGSFDGAASSRMHDARIKDGHRNALRRRERIDRELAQVGSWDRVIIGQVFEPFGRATPTLSACFTVGRLVLVRVAIETETASKVYQHTLRKKPSWSPEDGWQFLDWFESEARSLGRSEADIERLRKRKPSGHIFDGILREATRIAMSAIAAYDFVRTRIYVETERKREQDLARELDDPRLRLGAA